MDTIPALSTWKMLNETIPFLMRDFKEEILNGLEKITKSKIFISVIIPEKDSSITLAQFQNIVQKYKSFSTWLLGQFFYFLSCDKNHNVVIGAQLGILKHLSRSQLHVYSDLKKNYEIILHSLVQFYENKENSLRITVFDPKADEELGQILQLPPLELEITRSNSGVILLKIMKIVQYIVSESFLFRCFNIGTILGDLLYFLSESAIAVKLEILKIFTDVIHHNCREVEYEIAHFHSLFEQIVQNIYGNILPITEQDLKRFEDILKDYFAKQKNTRILKFLLQCSLKSNSEIKVSRELQNYLKSFVENYAEDLSVENVIESESVLGIWCLNFDENVANSVLTHLQTDCDVEKFLLFFNELALKSSGKQFYFMENELVFLFTTKLNRHFSENSSSVDFQTFFKNLPLLVRVKSWNIILSTLSYCFIKEKPPTLFSDFGTNLAAFKKEFAQFYGSLANFEYNQKQSLTILCELVHILSSGLVDFNRDEIDNVFLKIFQKILENNNEELEILLIKMLPNYLLITKDPDLVIGTTLTRLLTTENINLLKAIVKTLPTIICSTSSDFQRKFDGKMTEILCAQCRKVDCNLSGKIEINPQNTTLLLKRSVIFSMNIELKTLALEGFTSSSRHFVQFHQDFETVPQATKDELFTLLFESLTRWSKESLMTSNFDLQLTMLETLDNLRFFDMLPLIKILLYFIMTPTSKHSLSAINKFFELCEEHNSTPTETYRKYKKEICEIIAHLCSVNQALVDYNLVKSLERIAVTLEFGVSKVFIQREGHHLLPFFVTKTITIPKVKELIHEMAEIQGCEVGELLAMEYGKIFLHVFLNDTKENNRIINCYLEKTTGQSGPSLRKQNSQVILHELLLNFHENPEKVQTNLKILAEEDESSVQDYLQPKLLGLLKQFDFTLMSSSSCKKTVILSLADFFTFIGPKNLAPLRFKIIAMLRSIDGESCEIWDAFIRNCDVEALGPQLATIFVSLLPLLNDNQNQINDIFKYLVVNNEKFTKNYIKDLFFVINEPKIDAVVKNCIRKYASVLKDGPLKQKIQNCIKYLIHETLKVRVRGLRFLKTILEENREELDQMILGYNGIDPVIVELVDIVTLGCREKDNELKLACGELIGELGAIEPSHFPRRMAKNAKNFVFFANDDNFIVNTLSDLVKGLQGEKNTHSIDSYALAIQEILKINKISPDRNNSQNALWNKFSPQQKEVMFPLLSSKYIAKPSKTSNFPTPIYGSTIGASFQSWLYNWTSSLVSNLPKNHKPFFSVCLLAMKHDEKILMVLLPYILLHCLLEGDKSYRKPFDEITKIINSFDDKKTLSAKLLNERPFSASDTIASLETVTPEKFKQKQCAKVVFILIDFLDRWVRELLWQQGASALKNENFNKIQKFLSYFSKLKLAECNYQCAEYPRALMYLEDYLENRPLEVGNHLQFLSEIYAQLDEADAVAGVTALQVEEPSAEQRILALEISGKLSDAAACYERIKPLKIHHIQGLMQCYLDLDNVNTALYFAQGALTKHSYYEDLFAQMQAEPLWRLGRFDELENLIEDCPNGKSWGLNIGRILINHKKCDRQQFMENLNELRKLQVELLAATSLEEGTYQNGYSFVSKLHALNELHQVEKVTSDILLTPTDNALIKNLIDDLKHEWDLRIKVVQQSVKMMEPLLCLRRVSLEIAKIAVKDPAPNAVQPLNNLIGECWLQSAKIARKSGVHQQAYTCTLKAEEYAPPKLFLEKAKLHWLREEHEQALVTLKRGSEKILPNKNLLNTLTEEQRKICAEAKLLTAYYNDVMSNVSSEIIRADYKESAEIFKQWEKTYLRMGQYFDRMFQNYESDEDKDTKGGPIQLKIVDCFSKSLLYGSTYVYQSMPRMLSIWFDYGTRFYDLSESVVKNERKQTLLRLTQLIDISLQRLEPWVFLTAFSQLVSRICHPQKEVYIELKSIIIKLLVRYPQHTLWMIISVVKSGYALRSQRCGEILKHPQLATPAMSKLVTDFTNLAERLIDLCNKAVPTKVTTTTVSNLLKQLPRMLKSPEFSQIMIPTHRFRKLVLPNPDFKNGQFDPFPNQYVYIAGIEEEVTIMNSMMRPRKITLRGSDGNLYIQMLKPKDDLRRDFRLMEFNDVVNQLLSQEAESRQRRLHIRLYSVSPLNEECGLIEWLPNLVGLRPTIMTIYKQKKTGMTYSEIKVYTCQLKDPLEKKRDAFVKHILPKHPPVLGEWFRRTFPDAQSWLIARTAYIRTTAVMSMAGYILGLGDRHGENVLLDSSCGDVVHVDFNCLFNKGETLEWPERVPFRLTHNMVNAMGPLGIEGIFRKSCACTLRVLRENAATLMSIVTPFVYDPLVSWSYKNGKNGNSNPERINEKAFDYIRNIESRLQGIVKTKNGSNVKLSVDGHTDNLIKEATSIDNLCQMYNGWSAFY